MPSIQRVSLRIDGRWQAITLNGPVLSIAMANAKLIDLFVMHNDEVKSKVKDANVFVPFKYQFRAFATDQELPQDATKYIGTVTSNAGYTWHVFQREQAHTPRKPIEEAEESGE